MNKGSSNHYTLLLQDEIETDRVCLEEEEEEVEEGLNGTEGEEEDEEEEDEPVEEDSDEEEMFSSSKHRSLPHHECSSLNGQNHLGKKGGHGNEYQLLNNNDADLKTALDAPITIWTPTPMSPARRACFIASIMFGILVVATFLWVLPCDVQPCEGELAMRDTEWAIKIEKTVISQMQLVERLTGGHNVLLSFHPSINISSWDSDNSSYVEEERIQFENSQFDCTSCAQRMTGNGLCSLLMLDGNLGRKIWRVLLRECAVGLQCDLIDVSGDGVPDCIVRGSNTMLFAIEVRSGNKLWHAHQHKVTDSSNSSHLSTEATKLPKKLHNPGPAVLLPDVNGDGHQELLFPGKLVHEQVESHSQDYSSSEAQTPEMDLSPHPNELVLVCGHSGRILGTPYVLEQCQKILSLVVKDRGLTYTCLTFSEEKEEGIKSITTILNRIMGDLGFHQKSKALQDPKQSNHQHEPSVRQQDLCEVFVYSNGECPLCQSNIKLKNGDGEILWQKNYEHSTVVSWAPLLSDGKCQGVILKVWEWRHLTTTVKTAKPPPSMNRRSTRSSLISEEMEYLETEPSLIERDSEEEIHEKNTMEENSTSDTFEELENSQIKTGMLDLQPPTTLESPRARRDFFHPSLDQYYLRSAHRHHKQNSASHEDHNQHSQHSVSTGEQPQLNDVHDQDNTYSSRKVVTTAAIPSAFPGSFRPFHHSILPPKDYQQQQIHERLALLRNNGTAWHEETLTSLGLGITRLCISEGPCLPSIKPHYKSVAVSPGVKERVWQLVYSSTTFDSTAIRGDQHHASPWTITSIVRKIIVLV